MVVKVPWTPELKQSLQRWLQEDLGRGDLSSPAVHGVTGAACWLAKQSGLFCGGPLVEALFQQLDPAVQVELLVGEGHPIDSGARLLNLQGPAASLVAGERTALNLAMHLSGIATATSKLVMMLAGSGARLADTRKTTPGLRVLEKYAVRCGGACNHRFGLDDAVMLKENHLAWAGGIKVAMARVQAHAPWPARVIVEAETAAQAEDAVLAGADAVLLDEFDPGPLHTLVPRLRALARQQGRAIVLEVSGVDPELLRAYAACGVDLISTSAPVTRSPWLDFSMRYDSLLPTN